MDNFPLFLFAQRWSSTAAQSANSCQFRAIIGNSNQIFYQSFAKPQFQCRVFQSSNHSAQTRCTRAAILLLCRHLLQSNYIHTVQGYSRTSERAAAGYVNHRPIDRPASQCILISNHNQSSELLCRHRDIDLSLSQFTCFTDKTRAIKSQCSDTLS